MSSIIIRSSSELTPLPQLPIAVRPATLADLPFMDGLQKLHTKMVGWMPTKQLESKIKAGHVLIAEGRGERGEGTENARAQLAPCHWPLAPVPIGYCIATDQYFKHDDVGIIYQLNVLPGRQRGLIGATLLKAQFERSAYGCKLYCCWCAQDIAANYFWESMGFVPLAFRAGSEKRSRVHIFWQKRIRSGDTTTPFWFPAQTSSGAIREDRLVLPIPLGMKWSDAMPRILPCEAAEISGGSRSNLEDRGAKDVRSTTTKVLKHFGPAHAAAGIAAGALRLQPPRSAIGTTLPASMVRERTETQLRIKNENGERARPGEARRKMKNNPRMIAAARELRDRWLEEVNAGRFLPVSAGKYDIVRALPAVKPPPLGLLQAVQAASDEEVLERPLSPVTCVTDMGIGEHPVHEVPLLSCSS